MNGPENGCQALIREERGITALGLLSGLSDLSFGNEDG